VLRLDKPVADLQRYGAVLDHAVQRIRVDHVGIASDFNRSGGLADWSDVGGNLAVTAELLSRGHDDSDIAKLWGENFLRVRQHIQNARQSEPDTERRCYAHDKTVRSRATGKRGLQWHLRLLL
jgi:microsomal dipeptidase-like Zn-dependent dipeptidase